MDFEKILKKDKYTKEDLLHLINLSDEEKKFALSLSQYIRNNK